MYEFWVTIGLVWLTFDLLDRPFPNLTFLREEQVPIATLVKKTERKDLKTVEGGYVVVRRMTYGEKLQRSEMSGKMRILSQKTDKEAVGEINMLQKNVQLWEFANLILEHNLEHQEHTFAGGDCYTGKCGCPIRPLNFRMPADVELLTAQVGEEISKFLDELNNFEEDEEVKNSSSGSGQA